MSNFKEKVKDFVFGKKCALCEERHGTGLTGEIQTLLCKYRKAQSEYAAAQKRVEEAEQELENLERIPKSLYAKEL